MFTKFIFEDLVRKVNKLLVLVAILDVRYKNQLRYYKVIATAMTLEVLSKMRKKYREHFFGLSRLSPLSPYVTFIFTLTSLHYQILWCEQNDMLIFDFHLNVWFFGFFLFK